LSADATSVETAPLLVATDLDGCLLDERTYGFAEARPALARLAAAAVPLVLATSKTRAEVEPLSRGLDITAGLIVENGGALLMPPARFSRPPAGAALVRGLWTVVLGGRRAELVQALAEIEREAGTALRSFTTLGVAEVARLTGLDADAARLALEREYSEPFLIADESRAGAVTAAARARGLHVTRGGRFWHLTTGTDKGRALRLFLEVQAAEGRRFFVVGLGDAPNDLPLLRLADRAIVIPHNEGPDPVLSRELPRAERAPAPGPAGWNAAVLALLEGERLPALTDRSS
jgi:mannosyl-3-phosphoglycerate phosphatase